MSNALMTDAEWRAIAALRAATFAGLSRDILSTPETFRAAISIVNAFLERRAASTQTDAPAKPCTRKANHEPDYRAALKAYMMAVRADDIEIAERCMIPDWSDSVTPTQARVLSAIWDEIDREDVEL